MHSITLKSKERQFSDIFLFHFEVPRGFTWKAGQHVILFTDNGEERPLTIASAPSENELLITTRSLVGTTTSQFKKSLLTLQPGQTEQITDAAGDFLLEDTLVNPTLIAAGVGIAPFRAVIFDRLNRGISMAMHLYYYADLGEFIFQDEFKEISASHPEFVVDYIPSTIKEAGGVKQIEVRDGKDVLMSGVYVRTKAETLRNIENPNNLYELEEAEFMSAIKPLGG